MWLFLKRPKAVDLLVKRLDRLKVEVVDIEDSDHVLVPARMTLSIPWNGNAYVLWYRQWCGDGQFQIDDHVSLSFDGEEEKIVDIDAMFRQKLEKPLVDVIVDQIVDTVRRRTRNGPAGESHPESEPEDGAQHDDFK